MSALKTIELRQSGLKTWLRCRRKFMFEYLRELEMARNPNEPKKHLSLGSILHLCVDEFWQGGDARAKLFEIEQDVYARIDGPLSEEWVRIFKYLRAMVGAYISWVEEGHTASESVVAIEQQMSWEFGVYDDVLVTLTGKADRIVRDNFTGALGFIDLKKTQQFRHGLIHHFQLLTYATMYNRTTGEPVGRLMTEQVKEVLRDGKAKPPYVQRIELFVNSDMLDRHEQHLDAMLAEIVPLWMAFERVGEEEGTLIPSFYPSPTSDCSWDCPFLPLCTQMDDGSDHEYTIQTIYRRRAKEDTYL